MNGHGRAMAPGFPAAPVVDVQVVPVNDHKVVFLPVAGDGEAIMRQFQDRLNALSREGYALMLSVADQGYLIFGRIVGFQKLQVDTSKMVIPTR